MKKEGTIFIMEPERIVGLELQLELESNGYSVFQSNTFNQPEVFKDKHNIKLIIVNIDKVSASNFNDMRENFCLKEVSVIAISSGTHALKEYAGIPLVETFLKPFDSKEIASFIKKHFNAKGLGSKGVLVPNLTNRKYLDL